MQQTRQKWPYSVDPESLARNTGVNQFITSLGVEPLQPQSGVAWPVYALNIPLPARSICLLRTSGQG